VPDVQKAGARVARVEPRCGGHLLPLRYLWPRVDASQRCSELTADAGHRAAEELVIGSDGRFRWRPSIHDHRLAALLTRETGFAWHSMG
jgi:hypothetical protein